MDQLNIGSRNFVIISSIDWSENWQIHHQLATSLVYAGHRVLFVENTGVRAPRATKIDFRRILKRLQNWFKSTRGFFDVQKDLTVFSLLVLPFPYFRLAIWLNQWWISRTIEKWTQANRFHEPVVISFLPTPLVKRLIKNIDPVASIYYCANDMPGGSEAASALLHHEKEFLSQVDGIFCISNRLMHRALEVNENCHLFPGGVDLNKFADALKNPETPTDLLNFPHPIVGYIGTIGPVFDQRRVVFAAKSFPHTSFIIIGPEFADVSELRAVKNIHLLGPRPHDLVPRYLREFDLTIIPYIRNSFTDAVYPCKLNEYLAVGKPVVTSYLRELAIYKDQHGNVISLAATDKEFVDAIRLELESNSPSKVDDRIAAAKKNGWENQFRGMMAAIQDILNEKQTRPVTWQTRLTSIYRRKRRNLQYTIATGLLSYAFVFHTPLVWWAGQQLIIRQPPITADAIVVFSGDGEAGYINSSYQKRAFDAFSLYEKGFAKTIILSSGKGYSVSEAEVIKAILIARGVPSSSVLTTGNLPSSTVDNVRVSADFLRNRNINSVLFVTAPLHTRRAALVWKKLAPDIALRVTPVTDLVTDQAVWNVTAKYVRVIGFEYLALAYYWLKGWI